MFTQGIEASLVALLSSPQVIQSLARAVQSISVGPARKTQDPGEYDADDESHAVGKPKRRAKTLLEKEIHVSPSTHFPFNYLTALSDRVRYASTLRNTASG
jgi:hypothetical protein